MPKIRVGQTAEISVDALGGRKIEGKVTEIAPAAGSEFSAVKNDTATGNFVKIAQWIPVKIVPDSSEGDAGKLRPGMSVVAKIKAE